MDDFQELEEKMKQKSLRRFCVSDPRCPVCGQNDWTALEDHHMPPRKYGDFTHPICRNHHSRLTLLQRGHPADSGELSLQRQHDGRLLLSLADVFELIVRDRRLIGRQLLKSGEVLGGDRFLGEAALFEAVSPALRAVAIRILMGEEEVSP